MCLLHNDAKSVGCASVQQEEDDEAERAAIGAAGR